MTALAIAWAYVKKYWSLALLIVGGVVAFFIFRQREISFANEYKKIKDAHDEELKRIQEARAEEKRQHEENQRKLEAALAAVQQQYAEAKKDLDAKKKREIAELVKQYSDDPMALAQKLSEATGFTIVMPD